MTHTSASRPKLVLLLLGLALAAAAHAGLPSTMNYQGRMRLTSGAAVADSTSNSVAFALYTQAVGGASVWNETQTNVTTTAGLFNVQLGAVNPINVPFDQPYWLGVNFNGDGEMNPRTPLTMAPYAYRAKFAEGIPIPLSIDATVAGPIIGLINQDSTGSALRAQGKPGFNNSVGAKGEGGTGIWGLATSGAGRGVFAEQGLGAFALDVSGSARFQYGTVDFSGTTVTGLMMAVPVPLNLIGNPALGAVISATNTAGGGVGVAGLGLGVGVSGTATGGAGIGVLGQTNSLNGAGLKGVNDGSGAAILALGQSLGVSSSVTSGVAIYGSNAGPGGFIPAGLFVVNKTNHGVEGRNLEKGSLGTLGGDMTDGQVGVYGQSLTNAGVRGVGQTGVLGQVTATGQTAVYADASAVTNSTALHAKGNSLFDGLGNTATFSVFVSFTAGTNLGGAGVVAPLSLTLSSFTASPLSVSNATGVGVVVAGGVYGISATAANAAVFGRVSVTSGSSNGGVVGWNDGSGPGLLGNSIGGVGIEGRSVDQAAINGHASGNGFGVFGSSNNNDGIRGESSSGYPGVRGKNWSSGVGVWGESSAGTAIAGVGPGGGVWGQSTSLSSYGVSGTNSAGGGGVNADGGNVGLSATASSPAGVAVYAASTGLSPTAILRNDGAGPALRLEGSASVSSSSGVINMASFVSFSAGTNLGAIGLPLIGATGVGYPSGGVDVTNNGSGHGVIGRASKPGVLISGSLNYGSTMTAGVMGYSSASISAGVLGRNDEPSQFNVGVLGLSKNGIGAYGVSDAPSGGTGGQFESISGTGLVGRGAQALFADGYSSITPSARIRSLGGNSNALLVEGSSAFMANGLTSTVLRVDQTSMQPGAEGIHAYSNASGSAAVRGTNTDSNAPTANSIPGVGVMGEGTVGVAGLSPNLGGIGVVGSVSGTTAVGVKADNNGGGSALEADGGATGLGVKARGLNALEADANGPGGLAIHSVGGAIFDNLGSPSSVTFNTHVHFAGPVTGLSLTVSAAVPFSLTNPAAGPVIHAYSAAGSGIGVQGVAGFGTASVGLFGTNVAPAPMPVSSTGVYGYNNSFGNGVYGRNVSIGKAVVADGGAVALSATTNGGNAIYARNQGAFGVPAVLAQNDSPGSFSSAIVGFGQTGVVGSTTSSPVYNNEAGVYGESNAAGKPGVAGYNQFNGAGVVGASQTGVGVSATANNAPALIAQNSGSSINNAAVVGRNASASLGSAGIFGVGQSGIVGSTTTSPSLFANAGVYGESADAIHAGVYGFNNGGAPAVLGYSPVGIGVSGTSVTMVGVYGSTAGIGYGGVEGQGTHSGANYGYGVHGSASTNDGQRNAGVYGTYGAVPTPQNMVNGAGVIAANYINAGWGLYAISNLTGNKAIVADGGLMGLSATAADGINGVGGWFSAVSGVAGFGTRAGVQGSTNLLGVNANGGGGVVAKNSATSAATNPAVALDIDGGITMKTSRPDPSAGVVAVALGSCSGTNPAITSGSTVVTSNQIRTSSIILLSADAPGGTLFPVTVRLAGTNDGNFTVLVHALGQGVTCPGLGSVMVHYLIINQR